MIKLLLFMTIMNEMTESMERREVSDVEIAETCKFCKGETKIETVEFECVCDCCYTTILPRIPRIVCAKPGEIAQRSDASACDFDLCLKCAKHRELSQQETEELHSLKEKLDRIDSELDGLRERSAPASQSVRKLKEWQGVVNEICKTHENMLKQQGNSSGQRENDGNPSQSSSQTLSEQLEQPVREDISSPQKASPRVPSPREEITKEADARHSKSGAPASPQREIDIPSAKGERVECGEKSGAKSMNVFMIGCFVIGLLLQM